MNERVIWKYTLNTSLTPKMVRVPVGSTLLSVQLQNGQIVAWFNVTEMSGPNDNPPGWEDWYYQFVQTGGIVPDDPKMEYTSTHFFSGGSYALHLYVRKP